MNKHRIYTYKKIERHALEKYLTELFDELMFHNDFDGYVLTYDENVQDQRIMANRIMLNSMIHVNIIRIRSKNERQILTIRNLADLFIYSFVLPSLNGATR